MPFGYTAPASVSGGGGAGQINFTVTVAASKFVIDTVSQQVLTLLPGMTYRFDVSDSSNNGHLFQFSTTEDGTNNSGSQYSSGYTTNGTAGDGASDTYVQLDVPVNAPDELYYFCATSGHTGYGAAATLTAIAGGSGGGVTTVANKAALDAITPSSVTGQLHFVTANKGMYYSNGSVWTLLGSNAPAWGSFTEDYGNLTHTSAGGGDASYSNVVLAIKGDETISESGTLNAGADPFWDKTKILFQSRSQPTTEGGTRSMFNRTNRNLVPWHWNPQYGQYGHLLVCSTYGFPRADTAKAKFGTSSFKNSTNPNNPWDTQWIGMNYHWDQNYVPLDQDWTLELWINHNSLTSPNPPNLDCKIFNMGNLEFQYVLQRGRFEVWHAHKTANNWTWTNTELTGMRASMSSSTLLDGNWRHLAWQKEGTAGSMYINGARVAYDATVYATEHHEWCSDQSYLLGTWDVSQGLRQYGAWSPETEFENNYIHIFDGFWAHKSECNWDDLRYTVGQARYTGSSSVEWANNKYTNSAGATTSWTQPTDYNPLDGIETFNGVTRSFADGSPTAKTVYLSGGVGQTSSTVHSDETTTPHTVTYNGIVGASHQGFKKKVATAPGGWGKAFTTGYDNGALYVKGGSGSGDAGEDFNFLQGDFTVEFWIWMDSNWTMDGGYTVLMDFRDSDANLGDNWTGSDTEPFITRYASNERFRWRIGSLDCFTGGDGSLGQGYNPDTLAGYGEENYWLHVAFIRTGTSLVGYQNGIAGTAVTDNHNYNTNDYGITIGRSARHITSGTGRVYGPYVGTSPTWTYGDGLLGGGYFTNWTQRDDYRKDYGVAGQIQDIRITKSARTAPALDGSYMGAPYDNPLEHSDGGVTHTPSATGAAGSGYPQATSTLVATDEPNSDVVYAAPTNVTVSACTHSPSHTGSQTSVDAGLVVGSASGDVNITPPSAWEGDTVTAAVTASDGVNVLSKNIQWLVRSDAPTDQYIDKVILLITGNEVVSGGTFTSSDPTGHTVTVSGGASQSTSIVPFTSGQWSGGSSWQFRRSNGSDSNADRLTIPAHADFGFGENLPITMEWWAYHSSSQGGYMQWWAQNQNGSDTTLGRGIAFGSYIAAGFGMQSWLGNGNNNTQLATGAYNLGVLSPAMSPALVEDEWIHIAVTLKTTGDSSNPSFKLWLNGQYVSLPHGNIVSHSLDWSNYAGGGGLGNASWPLMIGGTTAGYCPRLDGNIAGLRITKETERYTDISGTTAAWSCFDEPTSMWGLVAP